MIQIPNCCSVAHFMPKINLYLNEWFSLVIDLSIFPDSYLIACTALFVYSLGIYSVLLISMLKHQHHMRVVRCYDSLESFCFYYIAYRCNPIVWLQYVSMERKLLKWNRPGKRFERAAGIHPSDRNLLFRGFWLRMARSGFAAFMIVGSYYLSVDYLVSRWIIRQRFATGY